MFGQRGRDASLAAVVLLAMSGTLGVSQVGSAAQRPSPLDPSRPTDPNRGDDPFSGRMADQLARGRNSERQKRLIADTDRLLNLATELKQQVDRTDKNMLSVDVVKKADEIEKLAHSVKEKMKGGA